MPEAPLEGGRAQEALRGEGGAERSIGIGIGGGGGRGGRRWRRCGRERRRQQHRESPKETSRQGQRVRHLPRGPRRSRVRPCADPRMHAPLPQGVRGRAAERGRAAGVSDVPRVGLGPPELGLQERLPGRYVVDVGIGAHLGAASSAGCVARRVGTRLDQDTGLDGGPRLEIKRARLHGSILLEVASRILEAEIAGLVKVRPHGIPDLVRLWERAGDDGLGRGDGHIGAAWHLDDDALGQGGHAQQEGSEHGLLRGA